MSPPNPDIDPVWAWVKQEQAMIWQQLDRAYPSGSKGSCHLLDLSCTTELAALAGANAASTTGVGCGPHSWSTPHPPP
jgi:hypothetical protein